MQCQPVSSWGGGGGGGGRRYIFENKISGNLSQNNVFLEISKSFSEEILHLKIVLQFQHAKAPSPQFGPPFLLTPFTKTFSY
jgi:hypothetical protein